MTQRNRTTILAVVLSIALLASACGGDDDAADTSDMTSAVADAESGFAGGDNDQRLVGGATRANGAEAPADTEAPAEWAAGADDADEAFAPRSPTSDTTSSGLFDDAPATTLPPTPENQAQFEDYGVRPFVDADDDPLSTFALDVDTGAYAIARQYLDGGQLPPESAVRVEEFVNSFDYGYPDPRSDALGITVDGGPSPFDRDNHLLRIGVQSQRLTNRERPDASLIFVIDTSGSMRDDGKLEMVKDALYELVAGLDRNDRIGIVEFNDRSRVLLEPTWADEQDTIVEAIDELVAGGSTDVEAGLDLGYALADDAFRRDGVNRVILLSDGIANQGLTAPDELADMIRRDADRGIQLLTVGVGRDAFNDTLMEQLANQGDGLYVFVDSRDEARRVFDDNLVATLVTLAIDAKIQVEFDPDVVDEYRLIGFENRGVLDRDFRNDDVDAGEIGAGHQVTALYEIELARGVDVDDRDDLGVARLRWEDPDSGRVTEIDHDLRLGDIQDDWRDADESFRLATTVMVFAEILRGSPYADDVSLDALAVDVADLADALGDERVDEFHTLVERAARLSS